MLDERPAGWDAGPFGRIAKVKSGFAFKSKDFCDPNEDSIAVIRMSDLKQGEVTWKTAKTVPVEIVSELERFRLKPGDFLFGMSGSLGNFGIVPNSEKPLYLNQRVGKLEPVNSDPIFLGHLFTSGSFLSEIVQRAAGNAQANISGKQIEAIEILIPPLAEQEKIAEILTNVDESIRATEAVIAQAERVKRGLMEDLLTNEEKTAQLSSISGFITKGATPTTYGFEWQTSGIPFLRSECVSEKGFSESGLAYICEDAHAAMERSVIRAGDILVTITGNVGRIAILPAEYTEANINQHIARVRLESEEVDKDYLYHFLSSPKQRAHYQSIVTGQAYPQLSLKQIRETEIPIKPLAEQRRIASVLNGVDSEISANHMIAKQLQRLKRGLMDDLLTGRVRTV